MALHRRLVTSARRAALAGVTVVALAVLVLTGIFLARGGRLYVVTTPSMGRTAPVGTLVLAEPARVAALRVGDVVAFHPPTTPEVTVVHRVARVLPADRREGAGRGPSPAVETQGDLNGSADPGVVTDRELVGRARWLLPGWGYGMKALPVLVGGGLLLAVLTHLWVPVRLRGSTRLVGLALLYAVAVLGLRPFVGITTVATSTSASGTRIAVVSTGMLPTRLTTVADGGRVAAPTPTPVRYGERVELAVRPLADGRPTRLRAQPQLGPAGWVLLWTLGLLPVAWTLTGWRRRTAEDGDAPAEETP